MTLLSFPLDRVTSSDRRPQEHSCSCSKAVLSQDSIHNSLVVEHQLMSAPEVPCGPCLVTISYNCTNQLQFTNKSRIKDVKPLLKVTKKGPG